MSPQYYYTLLLGEVVLGYHACVYFLRQFRGFLYQSAM